MLHVSPLCPLIIGGRARAWDLTCGLSQWSPVSRGGDTELWPLTSVRGDDIPVCGDMMSPENNVCHSHFL